MSNQNDEPAAFGYEGSVTPGRGPLIRLAQDSERSDSALVAPQDFRATITKLVGSESPVVELEVHVSDAGQPQLRSITVMADSDGHLTSDAFRRVPVRAMLRVATAMASARATRTADGGLALAWGSFDDELKIIEPKPEPSKRTSLVTDALLEEVAALYRDHPQAPARAVHELLPVRVSRATAGRYIAEARRRGFLGAAEPGKAGERA